MNITRLSILFAAAVALIGCNSQYIPTTAVSSTTSFGNYRVPENNEGFLNSELPGLFHYSISVMSAAGEQGAESLKETLGLPATHIIPPLPGRNQEGYYYYAYGKTKFAVHVRLMYCEMKTMRHRILSEYKFPLRLLRVPRQ